LPHFVLRARSNASPTIWPRSESSRSSIPSRQATGLLVSCRLSGHIRLNWTNR
jgi:hypothetical protein